MNVTAEMKAKVDAKLRECIAAAEHKYNTTVPFPTVRYDLRGTKAGWAQYSTWTVSFNAILLAENFEAFLEDTVPHEMAHLITDLVFPEAHQRGTPTYTVRGIRRGKRSPHGEAWKSVMRTLGADPVRCHNYNVENARVREKVSYDYKCLCCGEVLKFGPKQHAKQTAMPNFYTHRFCGRDHGMLVFVGKTAPAATVHVKPVDSTPKPAPDTGSKLARCYEIYKTYPTMARKDLIQQFVMQARCTAAGASTYLATCKKMYEAGV